MTGKTTQIVWTKQARESLKSILDYRYKEVPSARKIVRSDIIGSSKKLYFLNSISGMKFQKYRRIIVRGYKLGYKEQKNINS